MSVRPEEPYPDEFDDHTPGAGDPGARGVEDVLPPQPAAAVKVLGSMLRRWRLDRGQGLKEAADVIRGSASKISRLERGESPPKARDVRDLVRAYGVCDRVSLDLVEDLLQRACKRPWWQEYADVTPGWLRRLIDLEESAAIVRAWEAHVMPGLLQTEAYARAVIANGLPDASLAEIDLRVQLRLRRQEVLAAGQRHESLTAVLDESVLARPVGGAAVMIGQLEHLITEIERGRVQLRIVLFQNATTLLPPVSMTQLKFEHGGLGELFYLEQHESATYVSRTAEVERYRQLLERLFLAAESRARSKKILEDALRVYEKTAKG
jgi:transcriptional regulator with XRE-family HTH domain